MTTHGRWPIVCLHGDQVWTWTLRGRQLFGRPMDDQRRELDLGSVHTYDAGYCHDGAMFLLLERPGAPGKVDLELVRFDGSGRPSSEVLASVTPPAFSHCLPPAAPQTDWMPGWLDVRTLRHGAESISLPEPLAEVSALMPTGEPRNWPWVFTGVSSEGTGITGLIGRRWGWEPWEATSGLGVLLPGYLPYEGELWFLASHHRGAGDGVIVGRRWRENVGIVHRMSWSRPRALLALDETDREGVGGVIGCTRSPGFFWISSRECTCRWGALPPRADFEVSQCLVFSQKGDRVMPRPVRYRAPVCLHAGDGLPCHANGWGVVSPRYIAPVAPETCPLVQQCRPTHFGNERLAAAGGQEKVTRLRRALSLALLEVESLRRECDRLRGELGEDTKQSR